MLKKLYLTVISLLLLSSAAIGQASLEGKVTELGTGEPIVFGNVAIYSNGVLETGTETDIEGNYAFNDIDPGTYDVEFTYVGYQPKRIEGVLIKSNQVNRLNAELSEGVLMKEVEVVEYKIPIIDQDATSTGGTVTSETIRNLPTRSINSIAATVAGVSSIEGGAINIRGARSSGTVYLVDGVRVASLNLPESEIEQLTTITGGQPASIGDNTGGVISITTKGPSHQFSGGLEYETSSFTKYGYDLLRANISGPILKDKNTGRSILGYRLAGELQFIEDDGINYTGEYVLPQNYVDSLKQNPVSQFGQTAYSTGERYRDEFAGGPVELRDVRPNNENLSYNFTGKIDAQVTPMIDITLGGTYENREDDFYPSIAWQTFNYDRNPTLYAERWRGTFRFRHRISGNAEQGETNKNVLRNLQYSLRGGYEFNTNESYDAVHEDNFFDYGYIGVFDFDFMPLFLEGVSPFVEGLQNPITLPDGTLAGQVVSYSRNFRGYDLNYEINPVLARYNMPLEDVLENPNDISAFYAYNGNVAGSLEEIWNTHTNVGTVYNRYNENEERRINAGADVSFDLRPGGSDGGRHNIQLGFVFEQRTLRNYSMAPNRLWEIARLNANSHLSGTGLDTNNVVGTHTFEYLDSTYTLNVFAPRVSEDIAEDGFFRRFRARHGIALYEHVNIDEYTPDQFSLDMYTPSELTGTTNPVLSYYGYDYLGNKTSNSSTFSDFFTSRDPEGRRTFEVAPWNPYYIGGYIQDKFSYKDIIFRVGVRLDYYDANTQVPRDPLVFYDAYTVDEVLLLQQDPNNFPGETREFVGQVPDNIPDDAVVYITSTEGQEVFPKAYRQGNQWFTADGNPVNDPTNIFGGVGVIPFTSDLLADIQSDDFEVSNVFEDYDPEVNIMPRLSFSFPISDIANFFAHYDILVERPTPGQVYVSPLSYYYYEEAGRVPGNNPRLKPQKTIDYEVGYQQKLTNNSGLKISGYYREQRDMIQYRLIRFASPVSEFSTFDNLDFGTTKGVSVQYELRRTKNVEARVSYTFQFADGTGSDPESQANLVDRFGNIRTLSPLDFDERHRIVANVSFRYGSGKKYNGPVINGLEILSNFGVGLQFTSASGRPYTQAEEPARFGGSGIAGALNGARLPWNSRLDLRADKTFYLTDVNAKFPLAVNVFLRIQNLLDTRNVYGVYPATGSPTDDGYLTDNALGIALIETIAEGKGQIPSLSVENYLDAYSWRLETPNFFGGPRRVYLGAYINF